MSYKPKSTHSLSDLPFSIKIVESVIIKLRLIFIAFPKTLHNPLLKNGTVFLSVPFSVSEVKAEGNAPFFP